MCVDAWIGFTISYKLELFENMQSTNKLNSQIYPWTLEFMQVEFRPCTPSLSYGECPELKWFFLLIHELYKFMVKTCDLTSMLARKMD